MLANEWDGDLLDDWGLEIKDIGFDDLEKEQEEPE